MHAIVVDDSHAARLMVSHFVEALGFQVRLAEDGAKALALLDDDRPPDLMLIDWNMPGMNGGELVETIRSDRRFDAVKLMVVTIESELEIVKRALDAGADEYLMKPFSEEAVRDKLRLLGVEPGD